MQIAYRIRAITFNIPQYTIHNALQALGYEVHVQHLTTREEMASQFVYSRIFQTCALNLLRKRFAAVVFASTKYIYLRWSLCWWMRCTCQCYAINKRVHISEWLRKQSFLELLKSGNIEKKQEHTMEISNSCALLDWKSFVTPLLTRTSGFFPLALAYQYILHIIFQLIWVLFRQPSSQDDSVFVSLEDFD